MKEKVENKINGNVWGAFTHVAQRKFKILTVEGEVSVENVSFSARFHQQVKYYCYPFSPQSHLILDLVVEFSIASGAKGEKIAVLHSIVYDNRRKEWNRWIEFLRRLGKDYQGDKVRGLLVDNNISGTRKRIHAYSSPIPWQGAIIDLLKYCGTSNRSALLFCNGAYAVALEEHRLLWKPVEERLEIRDKP